MRRQYFEDKFIVPFAPLSEEEGIAQGYTIIKTAEDFESLGDMYGDIINLKILLINDIDIRENHRNLYLRDSEMNGNGHTIYTKRNVFKYLTYDTLTSLVKNLKVVMDTEVSSGSVAEHCINSTIDNCIIDSKFCHSGVLGGVVYVCEPNSTISNCIVRCHQINNEGRNTGGIVFHSINSTISNCNVEFKIDTILAPLKVGIICVDCQSSVITNCHGILYKNGELKRSDSFNSWLSPIYAISGSSINQVSAQFKIIKL